MDLLGSGMVVRRFHLIFILIAIVLASFAANPVFAITNPDSIKLHQVAVFRNYLEADDLLILVEYNVNYAVVPSEDPRRAFAVQLILEVTESGPPIVISDTIRGIRQIFYYGHAYQAMYFTAAGVVNQGLTWNMDKLKVCICANPILFSTVDSTNSYESKVSVDDTSIWIDGTLGGTTLDSLGSKILEITENASIASGQEYTTITNLGDRLSVAGATIAMKVIPGVRTLVPDIFAFTASIAEEPTAYTGAPKGQDFLEGNLPESMSTNLDALGLALFGEQEDSEGNPKATGMIIGGIGFVLIGISILGMIFNVTQAVTPAMVTGIPLILAGSMLGLIPIGLVFAVFFFILVLFGVTFIMSRMA